MAQAAFNLYKIHDSGGSYAQALTSFTVKAGIGVAANSARTFTSSEQASGGQVLAAGETSTTRAI